MAGPAAEQPDMTRFLSGHPADEKLPPPPAPSGPWIVSDDLKSIYAYLRTVKSIKNKVPDPVITPMK